MKPLDDLVPEKKSIGFIKLDVEGAELYVFKGARRIFAESRPIVLFECAASGISSFGITPDEIFGFITADLDYRIYLLKDWLGQGAALDLPRFESAMIYPFQAFNFVAAPESERSGSGDVTLPANRHTAASTLAWCSPSQSEAIGSAPVCLTRDCAARLRP